MAPTKNPDKIRKMKKKDKKIKLKNKIHKKKDKEFFNSSSTITKHKMKLQNKNKEIINYSSIESNIKRKKHKKKETKILTTPRPGPSPKAEISEEEKAEVNSRTVFVGNLPKSVTRKKLKKLFSKYGTVESARIRCSALNVSHIPRAIAIDKRDFHPKATSVIGYVKFVSKDSLKEALKANGTIYEEHHLRVDGIDNNKTENIQNSVFLGNLPFDVADNTVRKHFEDCGEIESVHVIRDCSTGMGKGFGYVNFKHPSSIELALKLNGLLLNKRNIRVKRAVKRFAEKRLNEKKIIDQKEVENKIDDSGLKSDEKILSFRPKRPKKEKKKKNESSELAFQGRTASKIKKKKSKKKLKKELIKKQLVEVLNKNGVKKK